jgi:hypothetical protein
MAIARRVKTKRLPQARKRTRKKNRPRRVAVPQARKEIKKEILGGLQTQVEQAKFFQPPQAAPAVHKPPQDLPYQYDRDRIILQVRDPWWLHAYWEVSRATWEKLKARLKDDFYKAKRVLRVYDVSHIIFNGTNAHRFFDVAINEGANNWYIDTAGPGRSWCVDLGLLLASGRFVTILRSNTVQTPLDGPSWITDEEWMIPDDRFARLYGMGFGLGRSSPVGKAWQERVKRALFSGAMASRGMSPVSSPQKKKHA